MFIIKCLWFILPAGLANMMPVFARKINFLNFPVDFGKTFRGKPIFGQSKTFRGFFFGIIVAILLVFVQSVLYDRYEWFKQISVVPYDQYNFVLLGFLMGFGALFGDLVKSFFKRRVGVEPGAKFVPWDQIDFIVGFLIFTSAVFRPPLAVAIFLLLVMPFFHIGINFLGYYLGINDTKW
jgi:CDP-2,3-bis-(O-geranylgeranyl)-sn-glycerol synthase